MNHCNIKKRTHSLVLALVVICLVGFNNSSLGQNIAERAYIRIETEAGNIEAEIYQKEAPLTAANFLKYVDEGFYTGGLFHRTVTLHNQPDNKIKIEVIQAQINPARLEQQYLSISLERTSVTGLRHEDGTLSMARLGPNTATSDFFICIGGQPSLDFGGMRNADGQGFAAFGKVTKGMDVVKKIQSASADGQKLKPLIQIKQIRRIP